MIPMLDHVAIQCADLEASGDFYDAVLTQVGARRMVDGEHIIGFGIESPTFWLGPQRTGEGFRETHLAFVAPDRAAVRAFHQAAVSMNVEVMHEPRIWPEYHPDYYATFVRDPDGNNVEAISHRPEPTS
jgi:catechol 2,3-dioxygenase-like lactoylglutathione lyase family enzyme